MVRRLLIISIFSVLLLYGCMISQEKSKTAENGPVLHISAESNCQKSGGIWKTFPNPCSLDTCDLIYNPIGPTGGCTQAEVNSCDCSSGKCWNGKECISDEAKLEFSCKLNNECEWISTNCCPESGGANWKCINKDKSILDCPLGGGCYQFVSPKPNQDCVCLNNQCQQK